MRIFKQSRKNFLRQREKQKVIKNIMLVDFTSPGLAFDALLKHSEAKLELLTDPDMLLSFEQGTRGGISTVTYRFRKSKQQVHE